MVFLGIVSGIVTPLGLGDQIRPGSARPVRFGYVPDLSNYGKGTMERPSLPLSRECGISSGFFCPGAHVPGLVINVTKNYNVSDTIGQGTTRIPQNITTMFTSSLQNSTIASILDLQYRTWMPFTSPLLNNHQPYPRGTFSHIENILPREGLVALEGVIADMTFGGVGFRNHSAPVGTAYGAEWVEDVLWIEPEVSCAQTNLSVAMTLRDLQYTDIIGSLDVVDDGGFARLRHGDPYETWPNLTYSAPDVRLRAEMTAWASNIITAFGLNITDTKHFQYGLNVTEGRHYPVTLGSTWSVQTLGLVTAELDSDWLNLPKAYLNFNGTWTVGDSLVHNSTDGTYPWASVLFSQLSDRCNVMNMDPSITWDHNVECSYLFSNPQRIDNQLPYPEVGSRWKSSVLVCAGAVKASIKTIAFRINGTNSLESLQVQYIQDKTYDSALDYPLWAMEDWRYPGNWAAHLAPLWGIVESAYEGTKGYNFTRAPSIYLPNVDSLPQGLTGTYPDILAGATAPYTVLRDVLQNAFRENSAAKYPRYSGSDTAGLRRKWHDLSSTSDFETIIRLVWTDVMSSITVGTNMRPSRLAAVYSRMVTYDWRYAVPAALFLASWMLFLLMGLFLAIFDRELILNLKQLLNYTSIGRIAVSMTDEAYNDSRQLPTREWLQKMGHIGINLSQGPETIIDHEQVPLHEGTLK